MISQRTFVVVLGAVLTSPLAAEARSAGKVYRIGYLSLHSHSEEDEAFRKALRERGWAEGRNIRIEHRSAEGRPERLDDLAADLVRLKVDVIFATNTPPAQAAKKATKTIPIVFTNVADPVRAGLVGNLARPAENLTGVSTISVDLMAKRLELLKEAVPAITRVAVFMNPLSPQAPFLLAEIETAARSLALELRVFEVRPASDLERAFLAIPKGQVGALMVLPDPMYFIPERRERMADLAVRSRLPMMGSQGMAKAGALMSYGPDLPELYRRIATIIEKIFNGAKPTDIPVEQPTKFELVINLRTAKALGLTIPPSLLIRADSVIE